VRQICRSALKSLPLGCTKSTCETSDIAAGPVTTPITSTTSDDPYGIELVAVDT
jgi:hypothetical protein